jgi:hypothetical protein
MQCGHCSNSELFERESSVRMVDALPPANATYPLDPSQSGSALLMGTATALETSACESRKRVAAAARSLSSNGQRDTLDRLRGITPPRQD